MPTVEKYDTADGPRYRVRFYLPKDPRLLTSKAIQRIASGFRTTREAQAHARRQIVDAERGKLDIISGRPIPLNDFLTTWMRQRKVAATTLAGDRSKIRLHVEPFFTETDIRSVTHEVLADFYRHLKDRGLGPNTILKIRTILLTAFKHALEEGIILSNPVVLKRSLPPSKREVAKAQRPIKFWPSATVSTFIDRCPSAAPHNMRQAALLALLGGFRREEVCGFQMEQVDVARSRVVIDRSRTSFYDEESASKKEAESTTKSARVRVVDLYPWLIEELRRCPTDQNGALFTMAPDALTRMWQRLCKRFVRAHPDLPTLTFHELRHTHASNLLEAGVAPKVVQERLGHSSIKVTMDTYSHLLDNAQEQAITALQALLSPSPTAPAAKPDAPQDKEALREELLAMVDALMAP